MIGSTIAHYRITAKLGEGGMGEVYRASDDRLQRDVAIKLLPASVEQDPARLSRFRREAQLLAALSHPNIASVYGLEEQDGRSAIVLELVEGETLAERVARGPLSVEDACAVALQIAEALEAAHEKGIVHRDLKPANVKLDPDGKVKVLDFGLAKALDVDGPEHDISNSPTMTAAGTMAGMVLGTAAYMAPEQAKGKRVDRRADIWAFGCVLYEMWTGRAPFSGEGVTEILAHVLTREPDLDALPSELPPSLRDLLSRCLRKDPRMRLPDIGAARIALLERESKDAGDASTLAPRRASWWTAAAFAAFGVAAGFVAAYALLPGDWPAPRAATHFDLRLENPWNENVFALSPDGRLLVYPGKGEGQTRLYLRRLDGNEVEPIPGTEGGDFPFFSADSSEVGFFVSGRLKAADLSGGTTRNIAPAVGSVSGAVWLPDDTILFTTNSTHVPMRVAGGGGEPAPLPIEGPDPSVDLLAPTPLPDGRRVLVTSRTGSPDGSEVVLLDARSGEWKSLVSGSSGVFVPPDRLLYLQSGQALSIGFDPERGAVFGDAVSAGLVEPAITNDMGVSLFDARASRSGMLIYPSGTVSVRSEVVRISATGEATATGLFGEFPLVDAEDRRMIVSRRPNSMFVLNRDGSETQVSFTDTAWYPLWNHDESLVLFSDRGSGHWLTRSVVPEGDRASEVHLDAFDNGFVTSVAADGTEMGYSIDPRTNRDIWIRRPGAEVEYVLNTSANERVPVISRDGRFFAYLSDDAGGDRVYLQDVAVPERRWVISETGGASPVWSRDGGEVAFLREGSLVVVPVRQGDVIRVGRERVVYSNDRLDVDSWGNRSFSSTPDGGWVVSLKERSDLTVRVVLDGLRR